MEGPAAPEPQSGSLFAGNQTAIAPGCPSVNAGPIALHSFSTPSVFDRLRTEVQRPRHRAKLQAILQNAGAESFHSPSQRKASRRCDHTSRRKSDTRACGSSTSWREVQGSTRGGDRAASRTNAEFHGRKGFPRFSASSAGTPRVMPGKAWKQQVPLIPPREGVDSTPGPTSCCTPTAGGKPIAIYTDGWEYTAADLATRCRQAHALATQRGVTCLGFKLG